MPRHRHVRIRTRHLLRGLALGALAAAGVTCKSDGPIDPPQDPVIALSGTSRSFSATQGGASPAAQTVAVTNGGGGTLSGLSANIAYGAGQPTRWLDAGLSSTTAPSTLTLSMTTGTLAGGTYTATVSVASGVARNSPQIVGVTFIVSGVPAAPSNLTATPTSGSDILLSWRDNSATELGFRIERAPGGTTSFVEIGTVGQSISTYQSGGLAAGTAYVYRVRAYDGAGTSPYSNTAAATTLSAPAAPSTLVAGTGSVSQINLSWTDNATNENGFRIERCTGSGCTSFVEITTVGPNVATYSNTGLGTGTAYSYRVRAYNTVGTSPYSNTATATTSDAPPAAPTLTGGAASSSTAITIYWSDNSANETGFRIERCTGPACSSFSDIATVGAGVTAYENIGLTASTSYTYRVRAYNSAGASPYSNTATIVTHDVSVAPAAPSNLVAAGVSGAINLTWTDNASNENGFLVERAPFGTTLFSQIVTIGANSTSYQDTGLPAGAAYTYRLRAYNGTGTSPYSNTASATTLVPLPAAPSNLGATAVSASQINLAWTDNATTETGFDVERCTGVGCSSFAALATVGANVTTYQSTGLAGGTTYGYRVRASNTSGSSAYSNTASATTQPTLVAPSLAVPGVNGADVTLTWTYTWQGLVSSNDGYRLEQSTSPTSGFVEVFSVASTQSPYSTTRTNLASGTYYFRVRALTQQGFTPYSTVRSATVSGPISTTLRVINDLPGIVVGSNDWGKLNTIIRVRVGPTQSSVINLNGGARELLYPLDFTSDFANTLDIVPGTEMTLDVAGYTTEYWLYIQTGYWEYYQPSSLWEKHMAVVAACDGVSSAYKWTTIRVFPPFGNPEVIRASDFLPPGNWYGSTYCP